MTRKQIERTVWAKEFKKDCPASYDEAIKYACDSDSEFEISYSTETGEPVWAIEIMTDDGNVYGCDEFWMDAMDTQKEAIALCKKMGWKYFVSKKGRC